MRVGVFWPTVTQKGARTRIGSRVWSIEWRYLVEFESPLTHISREREYSTLKLSKIVNDRHWSHARPLCDSWVSCFVLISCGRLSRLSVSYWPRVKFIVGYRIVICSYSMFCHSITTTCSVRNAWVSEESRVHLYELRFYDVCYC